MDGVQEAVQAHTNAKDCVWLFNTVGALSDFFVNQVCDKTTSEKKRKVALALEKNPKPEGNHVPPNVTVYKDAALDVWFDDD